MSAHPEHDPESDLWVEVAELGRCLLCGNPHTFPGRIAAWDLDGQQGVTISKSDVVRASDAAWRWIDGYLAGSEPSFAEYMGVDDEDEIHDDAASQRYADFLERFRTTGGCLLLGRRPTTPFPPQLSFVHRPWSLAGEEVWVWTGAEWCTADPQPPMEGGMLAGSVCEARGHCETIAVGVALIVCQDCGHTDEVDELH